MFLRVVTLTLLMFASLMARAQQMLQGDVVDAKTGEPVPFASVQYKGHGIGVAANVEGHYAIARHSGWVLTFSAVGYTPATVMVNSNVKGSLAVKLQADNTVLREVTVDASRGRYRRKNNPAVEMMRKVIAARRRTDLSQHDYYHYQKYQKLTMAVNVTQEMMEDPMYREKQWLVDQVETCPYNGKMILPFSIDETASEKVYRKNPQKEKTIVHGVSSKGVNHLVQTGDIVNTVVKDVFTDIDIYENQIRFLQYPFTSPIADEAIAFYRYYIEDTLDVDNDRCFHLHFLPNNQQDFGFRGDLFILADSSWQVKRCEMTIPRKSDVNFVDNMRVIQEFRRLPDGEWVLSVDDMFTELKFLDFMKSFSVIRNTRLSDYAFDQLPDRLFKGQREEVTDANAMMRGDDFWTEYRQVELTKSESSMDRFVKDLGNLKGYKYILVGLKALIENFIETGSDDHPSKVDIGPVTSFISTNFIDGLRTRFSAQTTANFHPNLFLKGYLARGWASGKMYYQGDVTWSFNKKAYLPYEFPIRTLTFSSAYDVMSPSDKFLRTDKDNVFTAFKWADTEKMMFYNRQSLKFQREEEWGLRTTFSLKTEANEAAGDLYFVPLSEKGDPSQWTNWSHPAPTGIPSRSIRTTELSAEIRFAPGEDIINTKQQRLVINLEAPVFTISHTWGVKGLLGADYSYNITEASVYKRFWLKSWGKLDMLLKGGVQWEKVPFPLLIMPETNLSYVVQDYAFETINNMEFPTDRFASLYLNWDMNGKLFNRIPLLRKLKWREWVAVRCMWGALSDRNNPLLAQNAGDPILMYFPEGSFVMDPDEPFWEISLGVHNIFKILHVEYVRRMNYNELPTAHKHGVRMKLQLTF